MSHGHPRDTRRFQCQRNALTCRWVMRQQASSRNASWMSARRSQRIRRRWKPCNQAKLLSRTQRGMPSPVPRRVPRRAIAGTDLVPVDVAVVAAVGEQRVQLPARMIDPAADRWDRVEQGQELGDVVRVAAGQQDREWGAVSVGDQVMLGAGLSPVDRRRTRVLPPFSALAWEESTTQRDQPRRAAAFSSASRTSCSRCQTPASFQSRSRRQHVMPDPKSRPLGTYSHWIPVCSPYKIPHSTSLSGNGLRPGRRNLRSRCGSSGSRRSHSSSDAIHGDAPTPNRTLNSRPGHGNQH